MNWSYNAAAYPGNSPEEKIRQAIDAAVRERDRWEMSCDNCGEVITPQNPAAKLGGDPGNPLSELRFRCPRCGKQSFTSKGPVITFPASVRLVREMERSATWRERIAEWWHGLWCGGWWSIAENGDAICNFCGREFKW